MKALVKIMPKKGVLDPQGKAIEKSLNQLGFSQIKKVIQGKLIEIEIDSIDETNTKKILNSFLEDKPLKPGSYRNRKNSAPEKNQILTNGHKNA